jgi:TonB family protein
MRFLVCAVMLICCVAATLRADSHSDQTSPKTLDELQQEGRDVTPPKLIRKVNPDYTDKMRKKKVTGTVVLTYIVDENGYPQDVKVKSSSNRALEVEAVKALRQWQFEPAQVDGKPTAVVSSAEISFRLY